MADQTPYDAWSEQAWQNAFMNAVSIVLSNARLKPGAMIQFNQSTGDVLANGKVVGRVIQVADGFEVSCG